MGYAREPQVVHLRLLAHLSGWLGERGLGGTALDESVIDHFIRDRRAAGHHDARSVRSLRPLLEYHEGLRALARPWPGEAA